MKIALAGLNNKKNNEIIKGFVSSFPNYVVLDKTIYDEVVDVDKFMEENHPNGSENWGYIEYFFYCRSKWLLEQLNNVSDERDVIFNGSALDLLAEAFSFLKEGELEESCLEKIMQDFKKFMKRIDLVMWLPCPEKIREEDLGENSGWKPMGVKKKEEDEEKKTEESYSGEEKHDSSTEIIYNNIVEEFYLEFDKSDLFPKRSGSIAHFMTENPEDELFDLVKFIDESSSDKQLQKMQDMQALEHAIKDKRLLKKMKEILSNPSIQLVDGTAQGGMEF